MPRPNEPFNRWTWPQIRFAAELWSQNKSADQIADGLTERFGIVVSKNSVLSIARKNRGLMPMKTAEQISQTASRCANQWRRVKGMSRCL